MSAWRRAAWIFVWIAVLSPFALYLWHLPRFGALQRNDYWGDFRQLVDDDRLTLFPLRWLQARSNEHRIALPLLLWTANIYLNDGDNRALSLLSLLLLLATFGVVWRLVPREVRGSPWAALGFGWPLAALLATPAAAHCWVLGFSGNQWYTANLSAVAAVACFARLRDQSSRRWLAAAALLTLPGAFSHSTHLALWPALFAGACLVPVARRSRTACGLFALVFPGFFVWGYSVPGGHPTPGSRPGAFLGFLAAYLGLKASSDVTLTQLWGAAGLLLFAAAAWLVLRRPPGEREPLVPPLLLATYALCNAAGTTLARAGMGVQTALASRYAPIPALFWIGTLGTLGLASLSLVESRRRSMALGAIGAIAFSLVVATHVVGWPLLRWHLSRVERQPLAALAMLWDVEDDDALRVLAYRPAQTRRSRGFFRRVGHIPFDRLSAWPLGEPWHDGAPATGGPAGAWRSARRLSAGFVAVAGTARAPHGDARRVLFLDTAGRLRGGGVFVPRDGAPPPALFSRPQRGAFWRGYVQRCAGALRPYLEVSAGGRDRLLPLAIEAEVERRLTASCGSSREPVQ